MNINPSKVIEIETKHLSSTEYTLEIDLKLPEKYEYHTEPHSNKLAVSFTGPDEGPTGQSMVVRDDPEFPIGIPVRGNDQWVALIIDYKFMYKKIGQDDVQSSSIRYRIPIHMDGDGEEKVIINEFLPV